MDIKLEKKPWYIRYRYYLIGGLLFAAFLIYVIVLSLGPRKLRIDAENIQIAEVKEDNFMEYVDVEGLIQPILTIKINTREAGSVESIVGEEGSLLYQGDTIIVLSNPDLLRSIEDQRDEWEKQMITYQEQEIEMEQKSLNLKQQALTNNYEDEDEAEQDSDEAFLNGGDDTESEDTGENDSEDNSDNDNDEENGEE